MKKNNIPNVSDLSRWIDLQLSTIIDGLSAGYALGNGNTVWIDKGATVFNVSLANGKTVEINSDNYSTAEEIANAIISTINNTPTTMNTKVKASERISAKCSEELAKSFRNFYSPGTIEYCEYTYAALLDNQFRIIGIIRCTEGVIDKALFNFKKVFQAALLCNAKAIAICHNHPSGSLYPSEDDKKSTRQLQEMCRVMQFTFIDHIILTADNYYSFNDNGNL